MQAMTLPGERAAAGPGLWAAWLWAGLLLMPIQFVQVGGAQLSQLWALAFVAWLILQRQAEVRPVELGAWLFFLACALVGTALTDYPRIKATEQVIKFGLIYPAFYLCGRAVGRQTLGRTLPHGYALLALALALEWLVQYLQVPVLHQHVAFMQGALHGTFKERNWLAIYFFLASYLLFLSSSRSVGQALKFMLMGVAVALLSESKTILVPVGLVLLVHMPRHWGIKTVLLTAGTVLFIWRFGHELSGQMLRVRLEEERGLALMQSLPLIADNIWGYGFGFVEAYFAKLWITVKGLGWGTNAIFCSPLDLVLIAGVAGALLWLVVFGGVGLGAFWLALPVAAWSLLNPLHQSEMVYFFLGWLATQGVARLEAQRSDDKVVSA